MPENEWAVIALSVCVGALLGGSLAAARELRERYLRSRRNRVCHVWLG